MRISDWSSDVCSSDLCRSTVLSSCDVNEKDGPSTSSGRTDRSIFSASPREPKPLRTLRSRRESYDVASLLFLTGRFTGFGRLNQKVHTAKLPSMARSEEHTSELQSLMRISYAVFCLKKKKRQTK